MEESTRWAPIAAQNSAPNTAHTPEFSKCHSHDVTFGAMHDKRRPVSGRPMSSSRLTSLVAPHPPVRVSSGELVKNARHVNK
jgi:hypothetical protein